jgi:hypothetical protein
MKSPVWRAFALLTLALLVVGIASNANAARRSALAGNYFIDDADDMFAFPQLYGQYQNMAIIDLAPSNFGTDMNGNASLVWGGEKNTFRFSTGRMDATARTTLFSWGGFDRVPAFGFASSPNGPFGPGGLFGSAPMARGWQWWDLGWSTDLNGKPFGVAFSWVADKNLSEDGTNPPTTDNSFNDFGFQLGYSPSANVDMAAEIGFGSYSDDTVVAPAPSQDFSTMNFGLTVRGRLMNVWGQNWRYLGGFAYAKGSPDDATLDDIKQMAFRGSFGPVFGTPGQWEVAGYLTFNYDKYTDDGDANDNTDDYTGTTMTLPGYNLAGEYYMNDWFVVRTGVTSAYRFYKDETGPATDKFRGFDYTWTAGFGIDKDSFGLDFALDEGNVHSGYFLNGATGGDTFAWISAWFNW